MNRNRIIPAAILSLLLLSLVSGVQPGGLPRAEAAGEVSIPQLQAPQIPQTNDRSPGGFGGGGLGGTGGALDRGPSPGAGGAIPAPASPAPNSTPSGPDNLDKLFNSSGSRTGAAGGKGEAEIALKDSHESTAQQTLVRIAKLAEQGDGEAQYRLGGLYYNGVALDRPENDKSDTKDKADAKAESEAKSKGKVNPDAANSFPSNRAKAVEWWQKASASGKGAAAAALAEYYAPSGGVEPNLPRSLVWYLKAIELGDRAAQATFGSMMILLSNDPVTRKEFFTNFPKPESPEYKKLLAIMPSFTPFPKDSTAIYELGFQALKGSADSGWTAAERDLAIEMNNEKSPHFDRQAAYRLFDILVAKRETIIFLHYGLSLVNFGKTKKDYQKAFELLEQATEMGENRALRGLANIYAKGLGVKRNPTKAYLYISKCAETALEFCGDFFANSYGIGNSPYGIRQDSELSFYWSRRVAMAGLPAGYQLLSSYYNNRAKQKLSPEEKAHAIYLAYLYRQMSIKDGDVESLQGSNRLYQQMGAEERNRANEFLSKWRASDPLPE